MQPLPTSHTFTSKLWRMLVSVWLSGTAESQNFPQLSTFPVGSTGGGRYFKISNQILSHLHLIINLAAASLNKNRIWESLRWGRLYPLLGPGYQSVLIIFQIRWSDLSAENFSDLTSPQQYIQDWYFSAREDEKYSNKLFLLITSFRVIIYLKSTWIVVNIPKFPSR